MRAVHGEYSRGHWDFSHETHCSCGCAQWMIRTGTSEPFTKHPVSSSKDWTELYHLQFRLDGKLIAIGIEQIMNIGMFSRAFYYDLNYKNLNLGNYSALIECFFVRKVKLRYFILGTYVHS